jgi:hypothetical protein
MSPSGLVITRLVKPVPGPEVVVCTKFAPTKRSLALVVVTTPLLLNPLVPCAAAITSSGFTVSSPLYSAMRMSGDAAVAENVTVTTLPFAATG